MAIFSKKSSSQIDYRQPWLKRVLIPFWIFQSIFMLAIIAITVSLSFVAGSLNLYFACINMAFILGEIVYFSIHRLHPLGYLITQIFKTGLWTSLFGITIAAVALNGGLPAGYRSTEFLLTLAIAEKVVVLLTFTGTLIYASVIYHRHRKGTPYHRSTRKTASSLASSHPPEYTGSFAEASTYTNRTPYNPTRDSTAAPEIDLDAHGREKKLGELDHADTEIREMYSPAEGEGEKEKGMNERELQGDEWVVEMSGERSRRTTTTTTGAVEK
ncbi:MAG: hypothetical protein Q9192_007771 [Flavoplaca navasiana]